MYSFRERSRIAVITSPTYYYVLYFGHPTAAVLFRTRCLARRKVSLPPGTYYYDDDGTLDPFVFGFY